MQNSEYTKIYSILGVFQDDGWEAIRAAYKRQIKRWHPDRFQDLDHRKVAEEKSKEINHAYQKLSDYYQKFGVLPPDHTPAPAETPDMRVPAATEQPDSQNPADSQTHGYSYAHSDAVEQPKRRHSYIPLVLAGVLLAVGYSLWEPEFLGHPDPTEMDLTGTPGSRAADGNETVSNNESLESEAMPVSDAPNQVAETHAGAWTTEIGNQTAYKKNAPAPSSGYKTAFDVESPASATTSLPLVIKKGSSKKEVLAVQGPPQRQTDTAWDYGVSRIYFQGDYVSGWHENPMHPLSVAR